MKDLIGRLIAYAFLGSFCIAGPLVLLLALGTAVQRTALVISGLHAEATVIGWRTAGSTRVTYAPVFQFTASDGRPYTVSSDVYGKQSDVRYGERIRVLYWPNHADSARIDAFAPLWTFPLVGGVVGAGFCVVPAIMLVAWLRRRASKVAPERREAAGRAADAVSRGLRRTLGVLLIGAGGVLLAFALGIVSTDRSVTGSRILMTTVGILLVASGVQVSQQLVTGSRFSRVFGSLAITAMAVMFGWVALFGDAANFHSGASTVGAPSAPISSAVSARILFAAVSILAGLASAWNWKQVFRSS